MKRLPNWIVVYANKIAKIPMAKSILKPLYYPFKKKIERNLNEAFRVHALELLENFDKCMNELGVQYTLIFGSLLGAIREKGFIGHDLDIDVAIFYEDRSEFLISLLKEYGFKLNHRFAIENGELGCEESFLFKETGVSIDIFYIHPAINEYPYVCCWNYAEGCVTYQESMRKFGYVTPRRIELPFNREFIRVDFETIKVNISANAHLLCEYSYGPDYMIPNPNYKVPTEHRYVWKEKKAHFEINHK